MDGLYIDGSLEKIKVLASEDFLNFQNNALDTCVNSTNSEEVPVSEEQPEDTTNLPLLTVVQFLLSVQHMQQKQFFLLRRHLLRIQNWLTAY